MTVRVHLFPSRTQQLSSLVPTILGWKRPGKIGRRQHKKNPLTSVRGFSFYLDIYVSCQYSVGQLNPLAVLRENGRTAPFSSCGNETYDRHKLPAAASGTGKIGRRQHKQNTLDFGLGCFCLFTGSTLNMRQSRIFDRLGRQATVA